MFLELTHSAHAYTSQRALQESLSNNFDSSFEATDVYGQSGIAWRTKDKQDGTYLFMLYDDAVETDVEDGSMVYFSRKLESEIRRVDDEIRKEQRQVSNLGLFK
jgi:hypothetical protein